MLLMMIFRLKEKLGVKMAHNVFSKIKKEYLKNKEDFNELLENKGKVLSLNELIESREQRENKREVIRERVVNNDLDDRYKEVQVSRNIQLVASKETLREIEEEKKEEFKDRHKKLSKMPSALLNEIQTQWEPYTNYKVKDEYSLYDGSYVKIHFDNNRNKSIYKIFEPVLDEDEKKELIEIKKYFRYIFENIGEGGSQKDKKDVIREASIKIMRRIGIKYDDNKTNKFCYYLNRDFLGLELIEPILHDKNIEDISCDGLGVPIYINHIKYGSLEVNRIYYDRESLNSFIIKMAQKCRKEITLAKPILQGKLPDGSRVEAIYGEEISQKGSTFTIRKFREVPFTPIHLISTGTMPSFLLAYLWLSLENKKSVIISGGTATGKTTVLNALSLFVPRSSKIISIEDTPEINLPHEHWISMVSREESTQKAQVSMFELLKASLRERPDYIIVGEIRGEEANVLFQGIATGHSGLGTVHSEKFEEFVNRMTIRPINLPKNLLVEVDILIFLKQLNIKNTLVRRVTSVVEINSYDKKEDKYDINEFMSFKQVEDSFTTSQRSLTISKLIELKGSTDDSVWTEIEKRKRILDLMVEKNIFEFYDVSKVLEKYYESPNTIFDYIKSFK